MINGRWLDTNGDKVRGLVSDLFREAGTADTMTGGDRQTGCTASIEVVRGWVRKALGRTKNYSTAVPNRVGYKLLKAVRDTKVGGEVLIVVIQAPCGLHPQRMEGHAGGPGPKPREGPYPYEELDASEPD